MPLRERNIKHATLMVAALAILTACITTAPVLSPTKAAEMDAIRAACAAMGLNPHAAPFVDCVGSLTESAAEVSQAGATPVPKNDGPYRAEDACAAIGLAPSTARYSYCVSNLRATIDQSKNIGAR